MNASSVFMNRIRSASVFRSVPVACVLLSCDSVLKMIADCGYVTLEIKQNILAKISSHLEREVDEGQLKITVFSDGGLESQALWDRIFNADVNYKYSSEFPLIPLPHNYIPADYLKYERHLLHFLCCSLLFRHRVSDMSAIFNLGDRDNPQMNLVIISRYLQPEDFGTWARLGSKHSSKQEVQCEHQHGNEPETTDEALPKVDTADQRSSSSGSGGQVSRGRTTRDSSTSIEDSPIDNEVVASDSDRSTPYETATSMSFSEADKGGNSTTECAPDSSGECSTEKTSLTSPPRMFPVVRKALETRIRRRAFEMLQAGKLASEEKASAEVSLTPNCRICEDFDALLQELDSS